MDRYWSTAWELGTPALGTDDTRPPRGACSHFSGLLLAIAQTEVYLDKLKISPSTLQAFFSSTSKTLSGWHAECPFPVPTGAVSVLIGLDFGWRAEAGP